MFGKKDKKIEEIKEQDEENYLTAMGLYDQLINLAKDEKPKIAPNLQQSKEDLRNKYINNLYGSITNLDNPYLNQTLLEATIPLLKKEIGNLKAIINNVKKQEQIIEEKTKTSEKYFKEKIHHAADDEFSTLLKWLQEIHDDYLLIFNKIDFEIFTKRKMAKISDSIFKYSDSHSSSLLQQYIYELDNAERFNKSDRYNNFHIKFLETVIQDWFWLYDTTQWIIRKEESGEKILVNPEDEILFSEEEMELEANLAYAARFNEKTQREAFMTVANLVTDVYENLEIEQIANKFNIELRPI